MGARLVPFCDQTRACCFPALVCDVFSCAYASRIAVVPALGKGEVVSSILTNSTINFNELPPIVAHERRRTSPELAQNAAGTPIAPCNQIATTKKGPARRRGSLRPGRTAGQASNRRMAKPIR